MIENILRVAVTKAEPAQQLDDLCVDRRQAQLGDRLLAGSQYRFVHLLRNLGHHLLNARRVNAPVQDQALHGLPRNLPAHRIVAGQHHRVGRVVNEHRDACCRFE